MRAQLLLAGIFSSGLVLLAVACGTETIYVTEDAGASSTSSSSGGKKPSSSTGGIVGDDDDTTGDDDDSTSSSSSSAGGPVTFDLPSTKLVDRDDVVLAALVGDDVIYQVAKQGSPRDFFAVPIAGGQPTKLFTLATGEGIAISGGAVAHWTAVTNGVGTLEVWSRATGLKQNIATNSVINAHFRASADGSRISFSQNATLEANKAVATEIGVRDTSAATNLVTFSGVNNSVNLASTQTCPPRFNFATGSKAFVAAFCSGTGATETRSRILTVPAANPSIVRVDAADEGSANLMRGASSISLDSTGTKIAGIDFTNRAATVFTVGATVTSLEIEQGANDVTMLPNGQAVIYRMVAANPDGGAPSITLKKGTIATPSVKTVVGSGVGILGPVSPDGSRLVYGTIRDTTTGQFDLHVLDLNAATAQPPVDLLNTAKGTLIGYNAAGTHFVWADSTAPAKLKAVKLADGTISEIGSGNGGRLATTGNGMVAFYKPNKQGSTTFYTIGAVDAVAGGAVKSISDAVPDGELFVKDKNIAYIRAKQGEYAIYGLTLP